MFDLLNEISELVYIADLESYDLLYMNTAGRQCFGIDDVHGLKCYSALQGKTAPCEFCTNSRLRPDCLNTWELTNELNQRHYLVKDKSVEWAGHKARMALAFDMTSADLRESALKNALDAENAILDCVRLLHTARNFSSALDQVLGKMGTFLEAERAYLFEIQDNILSSTHEWHAPGIQPQIGNQQNLHVPLDDSFRFSLQGNGQCLALENLDILREKHPEDYADLRSQGIERLVAVPLELDGQLMGYIEVDNPPAEKIEHITPLLNTLGYFISSSIRRQNDKRLLETLSYYDPLTGSLNRNAFVRDLEAFMVLPESVGVVCLDINGMKEINDAQGHPYGDQILIKMAETLTTLFGPGSLYRSGGDEFVVICRSISESDLEDRVRELRTLLASNMEYRASIGSRWAEECSGLQRILFEADEIMYEDKKKYYHGMPGARYRHNNDDILGLTKPGALQKMIREGCFLVYFQPKVSVYSGRQIGAEALVRLHTASDAIVAPDQFIPVLEQARLISLIDFYVFERVCENIARWRSEGCPVVPISVNFSRYSLSEKAFSERLREIWQRYSIPQDLLEIEVTETVEADDSCNFFHVIEETRKAGFPVSIDDFGVKHANLSLFTSMDFDVLKIDKSLVSELPKNPKAQAIIHSVADICRKMSIRLIAEGVETEEQLSILRELECSGAQGYLFSRPLPMDEYEGKYLRQ